MWKLIGSVILACISVMAIVCIMLQEAKEQGSAWTGATAKRTAERKYSGMRKEQKLIYGTAICIGLAILGSMGMHIFL